MAMESFFTRKKNLGKMKLIFLSRISRMKNLDSAIMMLDELKGEVEFNIYGPCEDQSYWKECERLNNKLPGNIRVQYLGPVANDRVIDIMAEHDIFFLPTLGENFGHVILEALVAGCPVIISDRTPWRGLEARGIGWDIPLEKPEQFKAVLQQCIDMDDQTYKLWSERARDYGLKFCTDENIVQQNRDLFRKALSFSVQEVL
jgi:glycosyltransferase involved in cell wall biosynthesis